jgi:hypothetical protein
VEAPQRAASISKRAPSAFARALRSMPPAQSASARATVLAKPKSGTRQGTQRFEEPVPAEGLIVSEIRRASGVFNTRGAKEWTPAHASKAACADQLPASLSTKRTAAFGSALPVRGASRFGSNLSGQAGTISGTVEGTVGGRVSRDLVYT